MVFDWYRRSSDCDWQCVGTGSDVAVGTVFGVWVRVGVRFGVRCYGWRCAWFCFWGVCPVLYLGLSELAIRFSGVQWYELIPLCGGGCVGTVSGAVFRAVTCCVMLCDGML